MAKFWALKLEITIASIVAASAGATAFADTVSVPPMKDNTIYSESEFTNGGGQYFFVGLNLHGGERRALIAFDVAGAVPAGSTIQCVSVTLHMSRTQGGASPIMVMFHRLTSDWGEGTVVGFQGEGGGAPPGPGDATWTYNFYNTLRWSMPGADGDRSPIPSAAGTVPNPVGFHTWRSTTLLVGDVQFWLDSSSSNFGWELLGTPIVSSAKRFDSRENTEAAFRPVLQIVYMPPMAGDGGLPDCGLPDAGAPDGGTVDGGSDAGSMNPDSGISPPGAGGPDGGAAGDKTSTELLNRGCACHSSSVASFACLLLVVLKFTRRRER
jgi:hypothetical protein